jgi:diguanylate cyclase (GGDEF)-like protein
LFDATHVAHFDLNYFGTVNREWGNDAGDTALAVIGGRCGSVPVEYGVVYRFGGDEFALVAAGTRARVIENLRRLLEQIRRPISAIDDHCVTATAGLVQILPGEDWWTASGRAHDEFITRRCLGSDRFNEL